MMSATVIKVKTLPRPPERAGGPRSPRDRPSTPGCGVPPASAYWPTGRRHVLCREVLMRRVGRGLLPARSRVRAPTARATASIMNLLRGSLEAAGPPISSGSLSPQPLCKPRETRPRLIRLSMRKGRRNCKTACSPRPRKEGNSVRLAFGMACTFGRHRGDAVGLLRRRARLDWVA
jgi:hypothetical protein